ncbi:MAG: ComEA family DNA-binding protein [Solirubrobacterales bacterium]
MNDVSRQMLVVYAAAVLAVALIGARYLSSARNEQAGSGSARSFSSAGATGSSGASSYGSPVVYVSGAVRRPGIVHMREGDRVGDAIDAAGGPRRSADLGAVNLAARVADGQQVVVPSRVAGGAGASGAAGPISLSTATLEQLDGLDGVGPGLAQKIIDYRTQHGGFRSVDELGEVPGIGDKRLESLRAQLSP